LDIRNKKIRTPLIFIDLVGENHSAPLLFASWLPPARAAAM
jgi:hypothetical protein